MHSTQNYQRCYIIHPPAICTHITEEEERNKYYNLINGQGNRKIPIHSINKIFSVVQSLLRHMKKNLFINQNFIYATE
jgi:hypothetical protein